MADQHFMGIPLKGKSGADAIVVIVDVVVVEVAIVVHVPCVVRVVAVRGTAPNQKRQTIDPITDSYIAEAFLA